MNDQSSGASGGTGGLQFDRAETPAATAAGSACVICKQPLSGSYFEVNGKTVCPACRDRLNTELNKYSPGVRFARALGLGAGAAVIGAGIYYGISALTGYEFGLVAIIVGLLVGKAVRKGSGGRGGWRYQALAMALTYLAIVATYTPYVFKGIKESMDSRVARDSSQVTTIDSTATPDRAVTPPAATSATPSKSRPGAGAIIVAFALLAGIILAAPIIAGVSSPIGLLIVAIALYEAWKINRGAAFTITGPYRVAAPSTGSA
ncbi:MAG TPA: hypothetical protein VNG95_04910 [Gemmatimonadales bacterium]|nr:hypothetical protein [Gemmatimonadales bacterium]